VSDDRDCCYTLLFPFVVCQTHGGPYDDEAFVAGVHFGGLYQQMADGMVPGPAYVPPELVAQLDLAAMHHGLTVTSQPWAEYPEEWTLVTFGLAVTTEVDRAVHEESWPPA
jgi:hypothetical protein